MSTLSGEAISQKQAKRDVVSMRSLKDLCLRSIIQYGDANEVRQKCESYLERVINEKRTESCVEIIDFFVSALHCFEQLKMRLFSDAAMLLEQKLIRGMDNIARLIWSQIWKQIDKIDLPEQGKMDQWNKTLHDAITLFMKSPPLPQNNELYKEITIVLTRLRLCYLFHNMRRICSGISDSQLIEQLKKLRCCVHSALSADQLNHKLDVLTQCCEQSVPWFQQFRGNVSKESRNEVKAWLSHHSSMLTTPINTFLVTSEVEQPVQPSLAEQGHIPGHCV